MNKQMNLTNDDDDGFKDLGDVEMIINVIIISDEW